MQPDSQEPPAPAPEPSPASDPMLAPANQGAGPEASPLPVLPEEHKDAPPTVKNKPKDPKNSNNVTLAIIATVIIVIALAVLAVLAYKKN